MTVQYDSTGDMGVQRMGVQSMGVQSLYLATVFSPP
jgi:hypothetical protein